MKILLIITALSLIAVIILVIKGCNDAKTFDAELRFLIWKIRSVPVELAYFKHLEREFEKINKLPEKNREQVSVAWCEFARRFKEFFPEFGPEANVKNVE